jgi:DNA-binding transcriptional LysR family regulator
MHLTAEGERYLEQIKEILGKITNLEDNTNERNQKLNGHIRISAPRGSASLVFLKTASDFMALHPELKISLLFVNRFG